MLFGLMIIITDSASAQNLCSKNLDGKQVYIEIANVTDNAFTVNLVDKNCKESSANQQVAPGGIFSQILTNGDALRVREAGTNKLLQEIVVDPSKVITLIETNFGNLAVRSFGSDNDYKKRADAAFAASKAQTTVAQSPSPVVPIKALIPAGSTIKKGVKYPSSSGNHYLILQNDGNLIVKTKNDGYVWGLDQLKKNSADRVEIGQDGSLEAYDKQGKAIWSPQAKRDPSAKLNITFNGSLQMVAGNGEILWSSDGNLSPTINVFSMKPNVKPCTPEAGWAKCIEMIEPSIQIIGTSAVSQSAMNGVANIYTEMANRFGAKYPKNKFNGFKVYMTNGEPWPALRSLTAIATRPEQPYNTSDDFYRGYGGENALWITEQMICKQGVKTRNATGKIKDNDNRTFDQVVHEFGHSIDFKYIPDQTLNTFRFQTLTALESFPYRIQQWFGSPAINDPIPANQEAVLKGLFTSRVVFSCEGYKP